MVLEATTDETHTVCKECRSQRIALVTRQLSAIKAEAKGIGTLDVPLVGQAEGLVGHRFVTAKRLSAMVTWITS